MNLPKNHISFEDCIDILETYLGDHDDRIEHKWTGAHLTQAIRIAIECLRKEIPKKVIVEKWLYTACPSGCGELLSTHHGDGIYTIDCQPDRCPNCGQSLDWG